MISFKKVAKKSDIESLYDLFYQSITIPFDGMWDEIIGYTQHWQISSQDQPIGFFALNTNNVLLNFFIKQEYLPLADDIFQQVLTKQIIKQAMVSTNNPVFMSICLDVAKSVHPHSYLFEDAQRVTLEPPKLAGISKPVLNTAQQEDFEVAVEFCVQTIAPPREWLEGYYQRLIDRQELFLWQDAANNQILGVCEARKSDTQPGVGDVGMIVSKNYRKQGVGIY